ncbi:MAG: phosphotransferase [Acidothermaceae bacterium]
MTVPVGSVFDAVLERMYDRDDVDTLSSHLEAACGIAVGKVSQLDIGVFRIDRSDGAPPLVARLFSAARPYAAAVGDLEVLRYLAEIAFPAERAVDDAAITSHNGQALLLTRFVKEAPKAKRPPYPIVRLGAMIGRLHGLPVPAAADRPSGALHHFADGTMDDELRAVTGWLDSIQGRVPDGSRRAFDTIRTALKAADGGAGLPEGFVHPDPVPKNAIFTADGPVLIDWTSAGRGPRLPSMAMVLKSRWAAVPFMKGYSRVATLTNEERDRLPGLLFSRQLTDLAFRVCRNPTTAGGAAKRLTALRRESEAKAREILAA